jgi:phenol 2-monooxygenase
MAFHRKFSSGELEVDNWHLSSSLASVRRILKTSGGFLSGTGVHYADSAIVNSKHQSHAQYLVIGERVPPQMVVCAADGTPCELQDLLPSDTRFKVLVFSGDFCGEQLRKVNVIADELLSEGGILSRYTPRDQDLSSTFDILTLSSAPLKKIKVGDLPKSLQFHWLK